MAFNKFFARNVKEWEDANLPVRDGEPADDKVKKLYNTYQAAIEKGAIFDARVFNIPKEEVTNCIYWRQLDAGRNSIQMVGQANFSQKELQNKTGNMIQDMLMVQKNINWDKLPVYQKRGSCVIRTRENEEERAKWIIDRNIPIFKGEGRDYIEKLIMAAE